MGHECENCGDRYWQRAMSNRDRASSTVVLSGRPNRDTPISREDIVDLKIALYTSTSLSEFLSRV